jgi:hypothetical protein
MESTRQLISKVPVFRLVELDGRTLTMSVGQSIDQDHGEITTVLRGTDEFGMIYVLACATERVDVRPK